MNTKEHAPISIRRFLVFSQMVVQNFDRDSCFILASSVVYSTLISSIPFLAFVIALMTAFGAFDMAKESFQEMFVQQFGSLAGIELLSQIDSFVKNAGNLGVVGLVSFLITSVILINRVWVTINQIYHTSINRNQLGRFAQFITVLVVGTLLLSAYFSVNAIMSDFLSQFLAIGVFLKILGKIGPWLIVFLSLFLLIFFIPNTRVRVRSAFVGAFVGTIAFQLANRLFTAVVLKMLNYSIIYGSLATILIFLVWLYLWWVIIFGAVEVAYVHQYRPDENGQKGLANPPAEQIACGFDILSTLSSHFKQGRGAMNVRDLGLILKIPDRTLYSYLDLLEQSGFIIKMDRTGRHYIPAKPLEDISIKEVAAVIYGQNPHDRGTWSEGDRIANEIYESGVSAIKEKNLDELI